MDGRHSTQLTKPGRRKTRSQAGLTIHSEVARPTAAIDAPAGWTLVAPGSMAEGFQTVIVWSASTEFPYTAYFDDEEKCWFSQHDGARIDKVTHWMHYMPPASSGSEGVRAAELDRLADQAKTLSQRLSAIQILAPNHQTDALLDCSSLADDFARDLDVFVGVQA